MSTKKLSVTQAALPGFEALLTASTRSSEARDSIRSLMRLGTSDAEWRGKSAIPAGSFVDVAVSAFKVATDIPLELPASVAMSLISTRLIQKGAVVNFGGSMVSPALWTVILAASGAGKTYTANTLMKYTTIADCFPEPSSAAKFVEDLATHNRSLWLRDEFGQFLKSIDQQTHLAEMRDYLLRLYDGKTIERNTKKEAIKIEDPSLVVLGMTVAESFKECVPAEAIVDGFAQRFLYTVANNDPARPPLSVPMYDIRAHENAISEAWRKIDQTSIHPVYEVSEEAVAAFIEDFHARRSEGDGLPPSFFRRVMFAAVRYACIYHVLLGDNDAVLTATDFAWAGRMVSQHLSDARAVLEDYGLGELERLVRRAEEVMADLESKGLKCTPRALIRRINKITTTAQASALLALIAPPANSGAAVREAA